MRKVHSTEKPQEYKIMQLHVQQWNCYIQRRQPLGMKTRCL